MKRSILIRFGELFLKGKNKSYFETALFRNIKQQLKGYKFNLYKTAGRFVVNNYDEIEEKELIDKISKVFGVYSLSPAICIETGLDSIKSAVNDIRLYTKNFKIEVNRADKRFPLNSIELARVLGGVIINNHPEIKVNLTQPETTVFIDIRENNETFIFYEVVKAHGGMPTGTAGSAMLLLSGGIDSPVSGYMMAKRGLQLEAIHYHSFPYTSEQAKEKVIKLAKIVSEYSGPIKLHIVPFTKIQEEIHKNTNSEYMITIMRRFMMMIAERVAKQNKAGALITGESLGQVASQTMESITVTNSVIKDLPVFRPLIGSDKEDIIEIAKKINTYETSILPYEDCCTVFLPEKPIIKPKLEKVLREEESLDFESLIEDAILGIETIIVS